MSDGFMDVVFNWLIDFIFIYTLILLIIGITVLFINLIKDLLD